ncbi:unnamed protein product [Strongylus vulgaris]|uniref:Uncharacterized protein n=1 Tax=Strongylus vulgaris TaxID=40348 RepID=A0A3P7JI29_STRVU|nr:unnamed protein product [Strongylus vulgaris]
MTSDAIDRLNQPDGGASGIGWQLLLSLGDPAIGETSSRISQAEKFDRIRGEKDPSHNVEGVGFVDLEEVIRKEYSFYKFVVGDFNAKTGYQKKESTGSGDLDQAGLRMLTVLLGSYPPARLSW